MLRTPVSLPRPGPALCPAPSCEGGSWRCLEVERVTRQARRMDSQGEQWYCMGLSSPTTDSNYYMTVETRFISAQEQILAQQVLFVRIHFM